MLDRVFTPSRGLLPLLPQLLLTLAATASAARAQEPGDDEPVRSGLVVALRDGGGNTAVRVEPQLAFDWGEAAPDPRLNPGEVRATWRGELLVQGRGDYRFAVFGAGEVELKIAGKVVVARRRLRSEWHHAPPVALPAGRQPLELSFRRTEKGARLMVLWAGPQFGLEPIPPRHLTHDRRQSPANDFERGRLLAHALRCARCHDDDFTPQPAPALDRLSGNLSRDWLVRWLAAGEHPSQGKDEAASPRRMPAFGLSAAQAEAVADWLLVRRPGADPAPVKEQPKPMPPPGKAKKGKKGAPPKARPDARTGERLFLTLGCVACHSWREVGGGGWFGGGDLTHIADKRPPGFFAAWLADPAKLNSDHRMPVFALSADERTSLALFLAAQKANDAKPDFTTRAPSARHAEGKKLVEAFRCASCHRLPDAPGRAPAGGRQAPRLGAGSDWQRACVGAPDATRHRPGYRLGESDARAVRAYYTTRRTDAARRGPALDGRLVLAEHNCLACHAREGARAALPLLPPLLADQLPALGKRHPDLAPQIPALTPPALHGVGDKLTDEALVESIARHGEPHRPYLRVRMPRFPLRDEELQALLRHFIASDRVPWGAREASPPPERAVQDRYTLAGGRLVSGDGFGCTSCHQVGSVVPAQASLNTRGPSLSQMGRRIRRAWYERFVRNPARIKPDLEMPSVQIPVSGVLGDQLDKQLAAVWHVLNLTDFEPPAPNPIRVLRHDGNHPAAEPLLVTDIVERNGSDLIKPFLVGLANRHNVVVDLEAGALTLWTVGDTARQRTKGKNWFWEMAGTPVLDTGHTSPDLTLLSEGREASARLRGQFVTEADAWQTEGAALTLHYRLDFTKGPLVLVRRRLAPLAPQGSATGFAQELSAGPLLRRSALRLRVLSPQTAARASLSADSRTLHLKDRFATRIVVREPAGAQFAADGSLTLAPAEGQSTVQVVLHYLSAIPVDRFPELPVPPTAPGKIEPVQVAPGFRGERLPLPPTIMPTGLTWRPDGRLIFASLRGQILEAFDSDGDGAADRVTVLADGLPSPYGAHAGPDYVDVSVKYGLLRLRGAAPAGKQVEVIASGWGYTKDYHDWAVGLPRNARGEYFLGIPCQQDKRSLVAARYHGNVLRLLPRQPTPDNPRLFALEPISAGHRFPTGLALDRSGELFVTDNQGNYNPFNELNHVRPGVYFGFINALDRGKPVPPVTPPAIDIPHPWTRSVNGIGFLDTPKALRAKLGRDVFGPLEGQLIGCEYDTRRLVRMSLQRVGDTFQGATYPLSIPPDDPAKGFLGPVVCGVSPQGDLYVGSIRDSGWGAGNNVGEVVRIHVAPEQLPCGIAEVRATRDGFTLDFFRPVDRTLAEQTASYAIESYRREVTPAYYNPDRDRRTEKVSAVTVAPDGRRVTLRFAEMRPGFMYEFRVRNLAPGGAEFYPAEAYYTLRVLPK